MLVFEYQIIHLLQASRRSLDGQQRLVWNFPLDITFRSTSPFGWPQLVVSVYGLDSLGNDVVRGYGAIHIPLTSTVHVPYVTLKIPVFVPESASIMQRIAGWILGRRPEFVDPRVVTSGIYQQQICKTYWVFSKCCLLILMP